MRVEHHRLRTTEALDVTVGADLDDLVAANPDGLGKRCHRIARVDVAVVDDQVNRATAVALGADDETGNEGGTDDYGNDDGGKATRHGTPCEWKASARHSSMRARDPGLRDNNRSQGAWP